MKKFSLIAILAAFLIGLAGCNTVKGVGKDVAALGNGVDHAATKVSNKMKLKAHLLVDRTRRAIERKKSRLCILHEARFFVNFPQNSDEFTNTGPRR